MYHKTPKTPLMMLPTLQAQAYSLSLSLYCFERANRSFGENIILNISTNLRDLIDKRDILVSFQSKK